MRAERGSDGVEDEVGGLGGGEETLFGGVSWCEGAWARGMGVGDEVIPVMGVIVGRDSPPVVR